jgi:hypothetical protein
MNKKYKTAGLTGMASELLEKVLIKKHEQGLTASRTGLMSEAVIRYWKPQLEANLQEQREVENG